MTERNKVLIFFWETDEKNQENHVKTIFILLPLFADNLNLKCKMKNILIIGSTGQIGSELTMKLRGIYGGSNVVAGYIPGAEPKGELLESGPSAIVDITIHHNIIFINTKPIP